MSDATLLPADRKEALSRAYVAAVAAGAGYTLAVQDFDLDGVDIQVRAGGAMRPSLDIQLKATVRLNEGWEGGFRYRLPRRNYDLLREPTLVPRILVVLDLPRDEGRWIDISADKLTMPALRLLDGHRRVPRNRKRGNGDNCSGEAESIRHRKPQGPDGTRQTRGRAMKARVLDAVALKAVSLAALAAYARSGGWVKTEPHGSHADIYVGDGRPEIVLPRTDRLGDYASVVSRLVGIFGTNRAAGTNWRCTVILSGQITMSSGFARSGPQTTARSFSTKASNWFPSPGKCSSQRRALRRRCGLSTGAGANREAAEYMRQVRLGQTEHSSFVVTLMAPVPPGLQPLLDESWTDFDNEPYERQVTRRLVQALEASREAAEKAHSGDGARAFERAVNYGVSANLCDAVARLIERSSGMEVSVSWARTRPTPESRRRIRFSESDAGTLREAARTFRAREPRPDVTLFGSVHTLTRDKHAIDGQVTFKVDMDGRIQSVGAVLDRNNYSVAISAHEARNPVVVTGDLERSGQRWRLTNAAVRELASDENDMDGTA